MKSVFRFLAVLSIPAVVTACGGSPEPATDRGFVPTAPGIGADSRESEAALQPGATGTAKVVRSNTRFKLVMPVNGRYEAVRDEQTGLVWERVAGKAPGGPPHSISSSQFGGDEQSGDTWYRALVGCTVRKTGNRYGWRLPTVSELASLLDPDEADPALPAGHPFTEASGAKWHAAAFWTATEYVQARSALDEDAVRRALDPSDAPRVRAWIVGFAGNGGIGGQLKIDRSARGNTQNQAPRPMLVWCVRGW